MTTVKVEAPEANEASETSGSAGAGATDQRKNIANVDSAKGMMNKSKAGERDREKALSKREGGSRKNVSKRKMERNRVRKFGVEREEEEGVFGGTPTVNDQAQSTEDNRALSAAVALKEEQQQPLTETVEVETGHNWHFAASESAVQRRKNKKNRQRRNPTAVAVRARSPSVSKELLQEVIPASANAEGNESETQTQKPAEVAEGGEVDNEEGDEPDVVSLPDEESPPEGTNGCAAPTVQPFADASLPPHGTGCFRDVHVEDAGAEVKTAHPELNKTDQAVVGETPERFDAASSRNPERSVEVPKLLNPLKEMEEKYSFPEDAFKDFVVDFNKPKYFFNGLVRMEIRRFEKKDFIAVVVYEKRPRTASMPTVEPSLSAASIVAATATNDEIVAAVRDAARCFEMVKAECSDRDSSEDRLSLIVSETSLPYLETRSIIPLKKRSERFVLANYFCTLCHHHVNSVEHAIQHFEGADHADAEKRRSALSRLTALSAPTEPQCESIREVLDEAFRSSDLRPEIYCRIDDCVKALTGLLQNEVHEDCSLVVFGSFLSRTANIRSDLNLSIVYPQCFKRGQLLRRVQKALQDDHSNRYSGPGALSTQYQRADPSVSLFLPPGVVHQRCLEVRLCTDSARHLSTSRLMALYCRLRSQFRALSIVFRQWASECSLDTVALGGLPKIAFDIMLVYFLQTKNLLPYLFASPAGNDEKGNDRAVGNFRDNFDEIVAEFGEDERNWNLGQLWVELFRFYVIERPAGNVVQVRSRKSPSETVGSRYTRKRLAVEDPFSPDRLMQPSTHFADYFSNCFLATFLYFAMPRGKLGPLVEYKLVYREPVPKKGKKKRGEGNEPAESENKGPPHREEANAKKKYSEPNRQCEGAVVPIATVVANNEREASGGTERMKEVEATGRVGGCSQQDDLPVIQRTLEVDTKRETCIGSGGELRAQHEETNDFLNYLTNTFWRDDPLTVIRTVGDDRDVCTFQGSISDLNVQKASESDQSSLAAEQRSEEDCAAADNSASASSEYPRTHLVELMSRAKQDADLAERLKSLQIYFRRSKPHVSESERAVDFPPASPVGEAASAVAKKKDDEGAKGEPNAKTISEFQLAIVEVDWDSVREKWAAMQQSEFHYEWRAPCFTYDSRPEIRCSCCAVVGHLIDDCPDLKVPDLFPLQPLTSERIMFINTLLHTVYDEMKMTKDYEKYMNSLRSQLERVLQEEYHADCRVSLFGSAGNGFGLVGSDADLCLRFASDALMDGVEPAEVVGNVSNIVRTMKGVTNVTLIANAKVPIVKFDWQHRYYRISADVSLYNVLALENTRLLRTYSELDERVKPLGICIKEWARACLIGDASRGSLSSYSYMIMLIHYLQRVNPPVLPFLQHGEFAERKIVEGCDVTFTPLNSYEWSAENRMSVADLWVGFFDYYARVFDFGSDVVQIRKMEPLSKLDKGWQTKPIAIEDPFDLNHNLSAGVYAKTFAYIRKTFACSRERFANIVPPIRYDVTSRKFETLVQTLIGGCKIGDGPPVERNCCLRCHQVGHFVENCSLNRSTGPSKAFRARNREAVPLREVPAPRDRRVKYSWTGPAASQAPEAARSSQRNPVQRAPLLSFSEGTVPSATNANDRPPAVIRTSSAGAAVSENVNRRDSEEYEATAGAWGTPRELPWKKRPKRFSNC